MLWLSVSSALALPVQPTLVAPGPHAAQVVEFGRSEPRPRVPPPRGVLPLPSPGPDLTVYGYLAYWNDDLVSVPWDDLTHLAVFSAGANSDGSLYDTHNWDLTPDAVAMAAPYGVKVHLCVTNFSPSSLDALLSSSAARNALIDDLVDWKADTGADGVNIDFEGLPLSVKDEMVTFTRDLQAAVGEVVLATPAVDWAGSWDYDQLTLYADLFIMGYGYHWSGSSYAGPTDPLYAGSGTVWSGINSYSLAWTVDDYLTWGANPDRVILGLPLYGEAWEAASNVVPAPTLGSGRSVVFADAWDDAAVWGRNWEPDSQTPYTFGGGEQIWYGDEESVRERIAYVRDQTPLSGVGFWALHYDGDDASFWGMIRDETTWSTAGTTEPGTTTDPGTTGTTDPGTTDTGEPPVDGPWVADAGLPFLAYVGDTVQLSGEGSRGPAGETMRYRWTQVSGPPVALSSTSDARPAFRIEGPGNLVFALEVGDGATWSAPARSYVVVIDPDLPDRYDRTCGCAGTGLGGVAPWALLAGLLVRRRR